MEQISLPKAFESLLKGTEYEGPVTTAVSNCCQFYGDPTRGLPFFPEYTGHGVAHVQRVLDSSAELVEKSARKLLTSEDATVITVAALLHDSAMHLTEDGFLNLVTTRGEDVLCPELDRDTWPIAWEKYFAEAIRWDGRQLRNVIGDVTEEAHGHIEDLAKYIKPIEEMGTPEEWTAKYRKFIGEFIRRHHARLAHQFSVTGVPGPTGQPPFTLVSLPTSELNDLAGLVARSHNMHLRNTLSYLQSRFYGRVTCLGAHPVFLMVLLRIADYLQVESDRAPASSLRVRQLRNPISRAEWSSHLAIKEVRQDEDDTEALFVVAQPDNARTFLKIQSLLNGLQTELDTSWAVLGELYSRQDELSKFAIRLRRVRSNLDDIDSYRKTVEFIPASFLFDTAGSVLLKKLVGPLYDERPEVGIRELLQNAIDAVNERRGSSDDSGDGQPDEDAQDPQIVVRVERNDEGEHWVTVEDFGVGMNESILREYFFRAGASFRESDAWRRTFAAEGSPTVIRSGRFGIGVLAAFLLGDFLQVTTRHASASEDGALSFSASIDDDLVELKKCVRKQPGTTIKVRINEATYSKLFQGDGIEWDWYRWNLPAIARVLDGNGDLPRLTRIPEPGGDLPDEWHRLKIGAYDDLIWTFGRAPHLVCNGLNIGVSASSQGYSRKMHWEGDSNRHDLSMAVGVPSVAVTDRLGTFPINLQRFNIIGHRYPFADELMADVTRDFIAFSLVFAPSSPTTGENALPRGMLFNYPGRADTVTASFRFSSQWFSQVRAQESSTGRAFDNFS